MARIKPEPDPRPYPPKRGKRKQPPVGGYAPPSREKKPKPTMPKGPSGSRKPMIPSTGPRTTPDDARKPMRPKSPNGPKGPSGSRKPMPAPPSGKGRIPMPKGPSGSRKPGIKTLPAYPSDKKPNIKTLPSYPSDKKPNIKLMPYKPKKKTNKQVY